jgi:hypothetical protein
MVVRASAVGLLSTWYCENSFHIQVLVVYSFATPPIKEKLEEQIGGRLLIANHVDQSLWWANQKQWAAVRFYLLHSFLQVHRVAAPFASHSNLTLMRTQNHFPEPNQAHVGFSSPNFTVQDHIPNPLCSRHPWLTTVRVSMGNQTLYFRATLNQHPPAHHVGWMISGQEIVFCWVPVH